jgi:hypothetical protein
MTSWNVGMGEFLHRRKGGILLGFCPDKNRFWRQTPLLAATQASAMPAGGTAEAPAGPPAVELNHSAAQKRGCVTHPRGRVARLA